MDQAVTAVDQAVGGQRPVLAGIRVIEVGNFMAVPFAGMQLADLGAEVIKVENPTGGDETRSTGPLIGGVGAAFLRLNRNKRSVALNLKDPEAAAVFVQLVETADVVIENLRPGAMDRLGLGYDALRVTKPDLIYVAASGWGRDGPLAGQPGFDIMAQARGGLMSITGDPSGAPAKAGLPVCDLVCALYVTIGVTAALHARDRTGGGQMIDVSLMESGVSFAVWEAGRYFTTGEVPARQGSAHQATAPYQAVATADGWVTVGAVTPGTWRAFCEVVGLADLVDDARYGDASVRFDNKEALIAAIEAVTRLESTATWVERFDRARVPCAPIQTYDQVFADPVLVERDFFWDAEHPTAGAVRQLGSPMRFSQAPTVRQAPAPVLGAHTRAVLEGLGIAEAAIDDLAARGAALAP